MKICEPVVSLLGIAQVMINIDGLDNLDNKISPILEKDGRASYSDIGDIVTNCNGQINARLISSQEVELIAGI